MSFHCHEISAGWTSVADGRLFYRTGKVMPAGGKVVILVHGLVISSRYMVPLVRLLAPRCRVYALDLPGFGKSYKPDKAFTIGQLADAIAAWMDAEGVGRASLLANSFGCQVVAEFCLRHRDRAELVVLQAPTVNRAERTFFKQLLRQLQNAVRERHRFCLALDIVRDHAAAGTLRVIDTIKAALADAIEEKLPFLDLPVLVVVGERDCIVPVEWARELVSLLPQGWLAVIPGAAHAINWSSPELLVQAIEQFLHLQKPSLP